MESTEQRIKEDVREHYTRAVTKGGGCCGGGCSDGSVLIPADRLMASSGYSTAELSSIPQDAVTNSFGCGNPLALAGVTTGQVVVDIGSGAGIDCFLASQKVGETGRVIGIDMTPAMLEKARANARKGNYTNVEFRQGEAESMPVESGSSDWIISNCVINLSPNKPAVFAEAFRVLRSGGQLSVSDIMVEELPETLRRSAALYSSCVSGAIPEGEYLEGLRRAGFVDVHVTERIVYDRDQILMMVEENFTPDEIEGLAKTPLPELIDRHVAGKIWSARVVARKP